MLNRSKPAKVVIFVVIAAEIVTKGLLTLLQLIASNLKIIGVATKVAAAEVIVVAATKVVVVVVAATAAKGVVSFPACCPRRARPRAHAHTPNHPPKH
jgi:hypothetical protein